MKVAIVGSRRYENKKKIKDFIFQLREGYGTGTTICIVQCHHQDMVNLIV